MKTVNSNPTSDLTDPLVLEKELNSVRIQNKRQKIKWATLNITFVSLLLSMSTAVSLINIVIPLGITGVNVGFTFKYWVIAISFQVVGVYWGMIIGMLDALLQFIIYGMSPLFRVMSGIGLMIWVVMFWLMFEKLFNIYKEENKVKKIIKLVVASLIILIIYPIISSGLSLIRLLIEGNGVLTKETIWVLLFKDYLSFMIFYVFAIMLFALTTLRIQSIVQKYHHK